MTTKKTGRTTPKLPKTKLPEGSLASVEEERFKDNDPALVAKLVEATNANLLETVRTGEDFGKIIRKEVLMQWNKEFYIDAVVNELFPVGSDKRLVVELAFQQWFAHKLKEFRNQCLAERDAQPNNKAAGLVLPNGAGGGLLLPDNG